MLGFDYLEKALIAWGRKHPAERVELLGMIAAYGAAISQTEKDEKLGTILMRAYRATAEKEGKTVEELVDWIFIPDDAEAVFLRVQVAT